MGILSVSSKCIHDVVYVLTSDQSQISVEGGGLQRIFYDLRSTLFEEY